MKSIILILAMIGIILLSVGYVKSNLQCPPPKIEYRYISKSFEDEQDVQQPILALGGMRSMFEDDKLKTTYRILKLLTELIGVVGNTVNILQIVYKKLNEELDAIDPNLLDKHKVCLKRRRRNDTIVLYSATRNYQRDV